MSDARTTILGRVRSALVTARLPAAVDVDADGEATELPGDAPATGLTRSDLLDRFAMESRALGVEVFIESSAAAVRERLASLTAGRRVLSWDLGHLPYDAGGALGAALDGSAPRAKQALAEVGVTGCHAAIAETGSLALLSQPGCSRAVSLLPALHVAIVRPDDLCFGMGEFFAARADDIARVSNLTFVTGPSRTADIELSLTIGVHGPARVVVIVGP